MGPVANASKGLSPTDPPPYDPTGDHQEWRRNIARWVDTIAQAAEKGEDRMYKTVFATLANHLYDRGLPNESKSFVDEAQANGQTNYKQDDQVAAVQEIVELRDLRALAGKTEFLGTRSPTASLSCREQDPTSNRRSPR